VCAFSLWWLSHSLEQSLKNTLKRSPLLLKKKKTDTEFSDTEFSERHKNKEANRRFWVGESCVRDWRKANDRDTFEEMWLTRWWSQGPSSRHRRGADCLDWGAKRYSSNHKKCFGFQVILRLYNASTIAVFNWFFCDTATVPFTQNGTVVSKIAVQRLN